MRRILYSITFDTNYFHENWPQFKFEVGHFYVESFFFVADLSAVDVVLISTHIAPPGGTAAYME